MHIMQSKARRVSTVQVVDSLAEITRYLDRDLIERSLLSTLAELDPQQQLRLYKVITTEPAIELGLVGHLYEGVMINESYMMRHEVEPELAEGLAEAVLTGDMVYMEDGETMLSVSIYPIFDRDGNLYSLVVQMCGSVCSENQRLTHGLLKIYANYLSLLDISQKDKLTNLLNRERLHGDVLQILNKQRMRFSPSSRRVEDDISRWLAVIDIDHFKQVNDRFGHLIGDEVLIAFARLLNKVFRDHDLLFRFGGEEFVVIIEVNQREDAVTAFERFRSSCEKNLFPTIGNATASLGVVEINDQQDSTEIIDQADQAMYIAKREGRNRIAFYDELLEQGIVSPRKAPQTGDIDLF